MKRFLTLSALSGCMLAAAVAAVCAWAIYSTRPILTADLTPAPPPEKQAAPNATVPLKLLTWNIQMLPVFLGGAIPNLDKMQYQRAEWIVDYLNHQDFDVICLQEAFDPKAVEILVKGLSTAYPYIVLPRYGAHKWQISNGILFASRVPIRYAAHIVFPPGAGVERFAAKGVTLIEGVKEGRPFQIAGTHFQTGADSFREADMKTAVHDLLEPNRKEKTPQFFLGDFNIKKDSSEYGNLLRETGMTDFPLDDPHPFTTDATNYWRRHKNKSAHIDHILLDPRGTGTTIAVQHIQREKHDYNGVAIDLSDHYGVIAEATLAN